MVTRLYSARNLSLFFALLLFASALGSESMRMINEREPMNRRRLAGIGSSPPTCRARCSRCLPCSPVHVVIQGDRSFPLDYYPEVWRCKCGDKLFMP